MSTSDQAPRRRLEMPPVDQWPRIGKLRLGEQVTVIDQQTGRPKERSGSVVTRPSAVDYFRVDPEDDVTSPESAASFLEVYGEKPRILRCQIPGRAPADVWEGAYRLYGTRKLKRRCDGVECDERTATGGWESKPCVCKARGIFDTPRGETPHKDRCKLGWTLNFLLPDVKGVGVWQITTASEISVRRVSGWLSMMANLVGDLLLLEFTLSLVPVDVTPDGNSKEVWVLEPRAVAASPQMLLEGGGRAQALGLPSGDIPVPEVPPPADDEHADEPGDDDGIQDAEVEEVGPAPPREQPPDGSEEDTRWRDRLDELRGLGASNQALISEATRILRRTANAWDLLDDDLFTELFGIFRAAQDGQESMLPPARREDQA